SGAKPATHSLLSSPRKRGPSSHRKCSDYWFPALPPLSRGAAGTTDLGSFCHFGFVSPDWLRLGSFCQIGFVSRLLVSSTARRRAAAVRAQPSAGVEATVFTCQTAKAALPPRSTL